MPVDPKISSRGKLFLKVFKSIGFVLVCVLVIAFIFKDAIIKTAAQRIGSSVLGARLSIGKFYWQFSTSQIVVQDIDIDHPVGYEQGYFVEIPQVVLKYDAIALSHGTWHLPLVLIDLKEMTVIKNSEGKLNIDALKVLHPEKETKSKSRIPSFMIDTLKLNVGQVIYKNYLNRTAPNVLVYNINFKNRVIKNIDSVPKLVGAVIIQAVKRTAVQGAGIYAAAAVMGVGFLPGAVLGVVVSKDDAAQDFGKGYSTMFDVCAKFVTEHGQKLRADKSKGSIEGKLDGTDVKIKLQKLSWFKTRVTVSARKFMLPKPEFAAGVLYQIGQNCCQ